MKLWILTPIEDLPGNQDTGGDPWEPWYDKYFGFVVRPEDEIAARRLAADKASNEGKDAWLDSSFSICQELDAEGDEGIILSDFHAA